MQTKDAPQNDLKYDRVTRTLRGYAAAYGNVDRTREVIVPGAFDSLRHTAEKGLVNDFGEAVPLCLHHDRRRPIGRVIAAREDEKGLYIEASVLPVPDADTAMTLYEGGVLRSLSVGYRTRRHGVATLTDGTKATALVKLGLDEVSMVAIPANPEAKIMGIKAVEPDEGTKAAGDAPGYGPAKTCGNCIHFRPDPQRPPIPGYHPEWRGSLCQRFRFESIPTHVCGDWGDPFAPVTTAEDNDGIVIESMGDEADKQAPAPDGEKGGRVLSGKNYELLSRAHSDIGNVLAAADGARILPGEAIRAPGMKAAAPVTAPTDPTDPTAFWSALAGLVPPRSPSC